MLQTTRSPKNSLLSIYVVERNRVSTIGGGNDCEDEMVEKSLSKNLNGVTGYLILEARLAFTKLRKTFTKALIFQHFHPECYIMIETDVLSYATGGVLSQLTLDNLSQWHSIAFYSRKMILAKTWYETYNDELLTIIEAFKT